MFRNDTDAEVADVIAFDRAATDADREILESADPDVPLDQAGIEFNTASNRGGVLMRCMLAAALAREAVAA